jgi:hypothetical protein
VKAEICGNTEDWSLKPNAKASPSKAVKNGYMAVCDMHNVILSEQETKTESQSIRFCKTVKYQNGEVMTKFDQTPTDENQVGN